MVDNRILKEIEEYCELNDLDVTETLNEAIRGGFTIIKFGTAPYSSKQKENTVEIIKEVIKEVPIIKEVIKEVPVEVLISDDTKINALLNNINLLEENKRELINTINQITDEKNKLNDELIKCQKEKVKTNSNNFDIYGE